MHEEQETRELPLGARKQLLHETPHDDADSQHRASGVSTDGHAEALECLESHYKPREKRIGTKWVVAVCMVGLVLMLFRCHLAFPRSLMSGLQHRGLGESGSDDNNDEKEPPSPEFQELCLEVGHWSPSPSPTEGPRMSPLMVESFLKNLVQEQEFVFDESTELELLGTGDWHPMESPTNGPRASPFMIQSFFEALERQALAGCGEAPLARPSGGESSPGLQVGVKRPASDDDNEKDDVPGPSGKVARTRWATLSTYRASRPSAAPSSPPWFCGAGAEAATTHSASAGPSSPTVSTASCASPSFVQAPSLSPPAAVSQSPSGQGSDVDVDSGGNSFLRVPSLQAGVTPRPFRADVLQAPQVEFFHIVLLRRLRVLLRKTSLTQMDADHVVLYSEHLANSARHRMNSPIQRMRPGRMAYRFGRRFLTFYILDVASRAVRQDWKREPWWTSLAACICTTVPESEKDEHIHSSGLDMWLTTKRLAAATDLYKAGGRPSCDEILHLLRKLFCLPAPGRFKEKMWRDKDCYFVRPSSSPTPADPSMHTAADDMFGALQWILFEYYQQRID
ncbi:hypothetical protein Efla_004901 [Eimeria flavescens]